MTSCLRRSLTRTLILLAVLAVAAGRLLTAAPPSQSAQGPASPKVVSDDNAVPGEVLVKFRPKVAHADIEAIAGEVDADWHRQIGGAGVRLLHSRSLKAKDLVSRLSRRPEVAYAEPNYIVRALDVPTDPHFPQLWGLENVGQPVNGGLPGTAGADISAVAAWDVSTGSAATVVAVIDTGIDYTHPDLAPNVWSAPASFSVTIGGARITCAAGTHGFNAITKTCDPMDDHDHGSHVSGTIGAAGNNDVGVVGVNWTTSIIGVKFLSAEGSGTTADAIDAIEFLIQAKAVFAETGGANVRVLSNSWGDTDFSQALLDEILRANDNDMLFVAAAGNSGVPNELFPTYPASYNAPNIIAVAATDNADRRAWFSNYGASTVHLGAPGVDILSTTIGNTYKFFNGTSMATPHVSGAAALVLSRCSLGTADLKGELLNSVDPVAGLDGFTITGGRLNVNSAIRGCSAAPAVPANLVATPGDSKVTLTWSAVPGAASYNVRRSSTAGGPYTTIGSPQTAAYTDTAVTNDVTYYYVVSAVNRLGESADSVEVDATPKIPSDLVVAAVQAPSSVAPGSIVSIADTTKNQGAGAAGASVTRFYLSANAMLDAADTLLDGSRTVPALAAGASSSGSTSVAFPANLPVGMYYVIAKADADAGVAEANETNNTASRVIQSGADLVVASLGVPGSAVAGATIVVTDTTKNQGAGVAAASTTRFYLSANPSLDSTDILLDGSRAVPSLAQGASSTGSTSVTIPDGVAAGTYCVFAKADADAAVPEMFEGNNTNLRSLPIGPDLVLSALQLPSTVAPGSVVSIADTTKNQGAGITGTSVTRFYLSTNATLDAEDTLLEGSRAVPSLAAGASSSGSTGVTFPANLAVGSYYVIGKADADATVGETNEGNNTSLRSVQIGADLVVSALTVPASVTAGAAVVVTDTTKNQGTGGAGPSTTRFYLSANGSLDSSDTLLSGSRGVAALAVGGSSTGSTSVAIPENVPAGSYFLIAKADADAAVAETSETNNTAARPVSLGPDLVVSALQPPATAAPGAAVSIADTTKNQGGNAAGGSITRFYLSTNAVLDATDTLLEGSRTVPPLAAGASSSGSTSVEFPANLAVGMYYLIAKTDADAAVAEASETNNTASRLIQSGADLVVAALGVPASAVAGATIVVTDTTKNQGAGVAGPSTTRFYLSANASLDSTDILLDGSRAVPSLAEGASSTGSTTVTIPAGLPAGTYCVFAKADADAVVVETFEGNNTTLRSLSVAAQLVALGLSGGLRSLTGGW